MNMKRNLNAAVSITGISFFILLFAGICFAQEFSADVLIKSKAGAFNGKTFVTKEKTRVEVQQSVTITRLDKKVIWILIPQQKMYMEQSVKPGNITATGGKMPGEIERTLVGKETIDGKKTGKYKVICKVGNQKMTVFQWLVTGSDIPVRTSAEDGSWTMEYTNLKVGKQPDSLFEIPAGYQKFTYTMPAMPSGPMKGAARQGK